MKWGDLSDHKFVSNCKRISMHLKTFKFIQIQWPLETTYNISLTLMPLCYNNSFTAKAVQTQSVGFNTQNKKGEKNYVLRTSVGWVLLVSKSDYKPVFVGTPAGKAHCTAVLQWVDIFSIPPSTPDSLHCLVYIIDNVFQTFNPQIPTSIRVENLRWQNWSSKINVVLWCWLSTPPPPPISCVLNPPQLVSTSCTIPRPSTSNLNKLISAAFLSSYRGWETHG